MRTFIASERRCLRASAVLSIVLLTVGLAACSGNSNPAPTVTKTVQPSDSTDSESPTSSDDASASPSQSASPSAAPTTSEAPKKPVRITWVQVNRDNEPGYMQQERLSVPTLENTAETVKQAFDTNVSSQLMRLRKGAVQSDSMPTPAPDGSYLTTKRFGSNVYDGHYASAIIDLDGASSNATEKVTFPISITLDTETGKTVPLRTFIRIPDASLKSLLTSKLRSQGIDASALGPDYSIVNDTEQYAWMVSDKGITFRFDYMYTDYTITLPWSDVRG